MRSAQLQESMKHQNADCRQDSPTTNNSTASAERGNTKSRLATDMNVLSDMLAAGTVTLGSNLVLDSAACRPKSCLLFRC